MADFDKYKKDSSYRAAVESSIGFIGQNLDFFTEVKANRLLGIIRRHYPARSDMTVLDVGAGVGLTDSYLAREISRLHGVDVSVGEIETARKKNPTVKYDIYDGRRLPYDDNQFEVAFAINVLHHVAPLAQEEFVSEFHRVIKPTGLVVIFEHNPINPLTRRAVRDCEFDKGVVLVGAAKLKTMLANVGFEPIESRYILFTPWQGKLFAAFDRALGWLPLGAQHYLVGRKK